MVVPRFPTREHNLCYFHMCFTGLMGTGKEQGFLVEEVFDSVVDIQRELFKYFFEKDEAKKVPIYPHYVHVYTPSRLCNILGFLLM